MSDLAYSFRALWRHPRYTLLAALTLATGFGVTVAMFGLLDAVFFRPIPIAAPERLVRLTFEAPASRFTMVSYPEFRDIQQQVPALEDVFVAGPRGVTLHHGDATELLLIHYVSGRYFPSLGIPLAAGRGFTDADDSPAATTPQVVINHHVWQRLGAPTDLVGRTIRLNDTHFTVIGITAAGFAGLDRTTRTDVWVTTAQAALVVDGLGGELKNPQQRWFHLMARLAPGATLADVRPQLELVTARWRADVPGAYADARLGIVPFGDEYRAEIRQGAIFLALAALVLVIACANVANLTLARGEARRREVAVRAALGASRGALLRQLLIESVMLSAVAGAGGMLLAVWLLQAVPILLPPGATALVVDTRADLRLVSFAAAMLLLTIAIVAILPAWRGSRGEITGALKGDNPLIAWRGRSVQLRDLLVVGEIALSGVMIVAAALLGRTFVQGLSINPGFDPGKNVATYDVVPGLHGYDADGTHRFVEQARTRIGALPGVTRVSYGIRLPAQGNEAGWAATFVIPGKQPPAGQDAFTIRYTMVGPDYFSVMGTPILRGRGVTDEDRPGSPPVAIISETMARQLWPGENPIGRRIRMGRRVPVEREIVGIAADIRIGGLYEPPEMYVYVPFAQQRQEFALLLVETAVDPGGLRAAVKAQLAAIDPSVPILGSSSVAEHWGLLLFDVRRNAWIGAATAALGLALAAIGLYGLVSLVALRRTREIGIRVALGATRAGLFRLLLGRGAALAACGGTLGVLGGIVAGRLLESQLHGVAAADPWSVALAAIVLVMVSLAANLIPAWRASAVDPVVALRGD